MPLKMVYNNICIYKPHFGSSLKSFIVTPFWGHLFKRLDKGNTMVQFTRVYAYLVRNGSLSSSLCYSFSFLHSIKLDCRFKWLIGDHWVIVLSPPPTLIFGQMLKCSDAPKKTFFGHINISRSLFIICSKVRWAAFYVRSE